MKTIIIKSIALSIITTLSICSTFAQGAVLRFDTDMDCLAKEYCATLQIKSSSLVPFQIGTSSVFFDYNREALSFKSYTSLNFDEKNICDLPIAAYVAHQYDEELNGKFNTTINLELEEAVCVEIQETFTDVAEICFDIVDNNKKSNLVFSDTHTSFNQVENNGELIDGLEFINKSEELHCANATGIDQVAQNDFDLLVNNPIQDFANITFQSTDSQNLELEIYDLNGKKVESINVNGQVGTNFESINLSSLSQGIYVFQLNSQTETSVVRVLKN